jgi:predicted SAM-dependent methyltransferase
MSHTILTLLKAPKSQVIQALTHTLSLVTPLKAFFLARRGIKILELGSGYKRGSNGLVTLDKVWKCDLPWDLKRGIPLPSDSVDVIYSSHLFEHIPFNDQARLLAECLRVLRPNGAFSICVPNARLPIAAYLRNTYFYSKEASASFAWPCTDSYIDQVNYIAYLNGQHKYMFDECNLLVMMNKCGLRDSRLREFDKAIDLECRRHESIFAIGYK